MSSRILVVDDTPRNAKLLADMLGANGFRAATASSGAEALESLSKEPADLVLLDVVMPGLSGYDVCREIRRREDTGYLPISTPGRSASAASRQGPTTS